MLPKRAFAKHGIVLVTFDEDDFTPVNHVATIVINRRAHPGWRLNARYAHYSLLAVERAFGLFSLAKARTARSLPLGPLP